jgi:hypothetical protein
MDATHSHQAFIRDAVAADTASAQGSLKTLVLLALALSSILIALSVPVAHSAPGGNGPDTDNQPNIPGLPQVPPPLPEVQASENPVVFLPGQDTKTITFDWNPQPDAKVSVTVHKGQVELWSKILDKGARGPLNLVVHYGKYYPIRVCRFGADKCPVYIITTERFDIADPTATRIPHPQPPQIDTGSIPEPPEVNRTPQRRESSRS